MKRTKKMQRLQLVFIGLAVLAVSFSLAQLHKSVDETAYCCPGYPIPPCWPDCQEPPDSR